MTECDDAWHVIYVLFFLLTFSLILFHRHSIIIVLHLLPHIKEFDYLISTVAGQQCLIRVRVELNIGKKAQNEK